jgi:chromosome segregation ATPase
MDDLDAAIARLEVEFGEMQSDPTTVRKYQDLSRSLDELKRSVSEYQTTVDTCQAEIKELEARWLPALKEKVEIVNQKFQVKMSNLRCAGCVELVPDPNGDYAGYSLVISVAYREGTKLKALSGTSQSGGVRSHTPFPPHYAAVTHAF